MSARWARTSAQGAVAVAVVIGVLIASQGRVNADLATAGPGVLWAGWSSYVGTLATVVVVIAARRRVRATAAILRAQARWWWFAIGLCSVPIVYAMSYGIPVLGVALASVCSLAGQTVSGMLLDARGVGVVAPIRVSARRILAGLCAIAGLMVAMIFGPGGVSGSLIALVLAGLALFVGGFLLSGQQSGNGQVTQATGDPVLASLTSLTGGLVATTLVVAVVAARDGLAVPWPDLAGHWVLYLGGPLGAAITVAAAWAVRHLGTFALTLAVVGGQMVAAIVLDVTLGLGLHWATVLAVAAVAGATVLAVDRGGRVAVADDVGPVPVGR